MVNKTKKLSPLSSTSEIAERLLYENRQQYLGFAGHEVFYSTKSYKVNI